MKVHIYINIDSQIIYVSTVRSSKTKKRVRGAGLNTKPKVSPVRSGVFAGSRRL